MQIKPCPWCGGTSVAAEEGSTFKWVAAVCSCDARGPEVRVPSPALNPDNVEAAKVAAMEEWNKRFVYGNQ